MSAAWLTPALDKPLSDIAAKRLVEKARNSRRLTLHRLLLLTPIRTPPLSFYTLQI
jgi:hypothetical protein